eukprot:m51a1_g7322 hypothetical protein (295) ;mRNA; f:149941-151558
MMTQPTWAVRYQDEIEEGVFAFVQDYEDDDERDGRLGEAHDRGVRVVNAEYVKRCVSEGRLVDWLLFASETGVPSLDSSRYLAIRCLPPGLVLYVPGLSCGLGLSTCTQFAAIDEEAREYEELQQTVAEYSRRTEREGLLCTLYLVQDDLWQEGSEGDPVLGRANGDGGCVVSVARMVREKRGPVTGQRLSAVLSTCAHEVGHTMGHDHCVYYSCLMNSWCQGAEVSDESQQISPGLQVLCPVDLRKVALRVGPDRWLRELEPHYHDGLARFFGREERSLDHVTEWLARRLHDT